MMKKNVKRTERGIPHPILLQPVVMVIEVILPPRVGGAMIIRNIQSSKNLLQAIDHQTRATGAIDQGHPENVGRDQDHLVSLVPSTSLIPILGLDLVPSTNLIRLDLVLVIVNIARNTRIPQNMIESFNGILYSCVNVEQVVCNLTN